MSQKQVYTDGGDDGNPEVIYWKKKAEKGRWVECRIVNGEW
jgi:hypothetical protein